MKVMVYSMGELIGDGLIKLPFMAGVRAAWPDAHVTWCAASGATVYAGPLKAVVEGLVDEVLTDGPTGFGALDWLTAWRPFGGRTFDVVIDTQGNLRRSVVAKRAAKGLFVSPTVLSDRKVPCWPETVVERMDVLLRLAAGEGASSRPLTLANEAALAAAEALLPRGPTYIGFAPGAGGRNKRWPLESFLALAGEQAGAGRMPVFFFGPDEAEDLAAARAAMPDALYPESMGAAVKGPLLVIALAGRLAAAVANDGGPGHMLAAGGAPLLSLQLDRRKAVKFRPAARRLEVLVAADYGDGMAALPLDAARAGLERLLA